MNYPAAIKAFYMKPVLEIQSAFCRLARTRRLRRNHHGSMREEDYDALVAKMDELGMDHYRYEFYLDLRKYGTVTRRICIGIERMVTFA